MDSNNLTLKTYQEHFSSYMDGTVSVTSGSQKEWLEYMLGLIDTNATIFEIGSAFGRDATFIQDKGYKNLIVSDAFDAAIGELVKQGFKAKKLNILTDELPTGIDFLLAAAVFLHFNNAELTMVLNKIHNSLDNDKLLGFSVKIGKGSEWSEHKMNAPRFFQYWRKDEMETLLQSIGYEVLDARVVEDGKWLCVTCRVVK